MREPDWSFVAMEYYAIILNRTFLVTINEESLIGVKCRGITSIASGSFDPLIDSATSKLAVHGDLDDPSSYVNKRLLGKKSSANFTILLKEILAVEFNPRKKWGMGYYPHDGRIFVTTSKSRRELIILGRQYGAHISARLVKAIERANPLFKPTPLRGSA